MVRCCLPDFVCSYKILNPAGVDKESDPKKIAQVILEATGLDPESYRIGHTKARNLRPQQLEWSNPNEQALKNRVVTTLLHKIASYTVLVIFLHTIPYLKMNGTL